MTRTQMRLALLSLLWCAASSAIAADVSGVVHWAQRVELGLPVSGVIAAVHVQAGQSVDKDTELISLDARRFKSRVGRHQAEYRHAKALLDEAQREDERAIELYDRTVLSDFERNQALIGLEAARARAQSAYAALLEARLDLEHSVIRAPFAGVVLAVDAAPGQSVVSELQSKPLVTLADDRVYRVLARVDAAQAGALPPGAEIGATVRGKAIRSRVHHVGLEPVGQSGQEPRYELVAEIVTDAGHALRVGETVILHLEP